MITATGDDEDEHGNTIPSPKHLGNGKMTDRVLLNQNMVTQNLVKYLTHWKTLMDRQTTL